MNGRLTLSFTVATFIAAIGLLYFLSDVRTRLTHVERDLDARANLPAAGPGQAPANGGGEAAQPPDPLSTKDVNAKLDWLVEKLEEVHTQVYEGVIDLESEMYQLRQEIGRIKVRTTRILEGLRASGQFEGFTSSLPDPKTPLTMEQRKEYKAEAERWGMQVKDGLLIARGLLNGEQDRAMPIEYLMTRYPEAGHETLLHLMGKAKLEDFNEPPFPNLTGVCTALYKGLLAAGFLQGKYSHPEREPKEPFEQVPWVMATGDTVHMYVRWLDEDGTPVHARATDWMLDPKTKGVLPEDAFKFTGSMRVEHRETGDEMLLSEGNGFLVSAYPDRSALIEVAVPSVIGGHLAYNWSRLPKHTPGKPFYVDLLFSRTPLTKEAIAAAARKQDEPKKDDAEK